MNDSELKKFLISVKPPEPDDSARERALHRATVALAQPLATSALNREDSSTLPLSSRWIAVMGVTLIAVLLAARSFLAVPREDTGADLRVMAQLEGLFPGQLNAVIEHGGHVQLDLAGEPTPNATDQRVLVQLESGGNGYRVLSYSGRSVSIELKGRRLTFETLVTSEGGVVLSGDDFVWSSEQPKPLAGYRVQARALSSL